MIFKPNNTKIVIFGNSGSGKTTLAKEYTKKYAVAHLDLDILAWQDTNPPARAPLSESSSKINHFISNNENWVIEGCYADLLSFAVEHASNLIFLNPSIETCIANCNNRPWEPHKYKTEALQKHNLTILLEWIKQYPIREDEFSLQSHQAIFDSFTGSKVEYVSNDKKTKT